VLVDSINIDPDRLGLFVARLDDEGSPEPSFGDGGSVTTPLRHWNFADGIAVRPEGRIVIGGTNEDDDGPSSKMIAVQLEG
jgi:hypothetical protein